MTNVDQQLALEHALAAEAIADYGRYAAYGINAEDFESSNAQDAVRAAEAAWSAHGEHGIEAVCRELQRQGKLQKLGGNRGVMDFFLAGGAPDADLFRERVRLRRVKAKLVAALSATSQEDLPAVLAALGDAQAAAEDKARDDVVTGTYLAQKAITDLTVSPEQAEACHPGWDKLEEYIGALPLGSLTVIAGNTSTGKSSYALEMLIRMAQRGIVCGMVSLEDPEAIAGSRLLAMESGVPSFAIQRRRLDRRDFQALSSAIAYGKEHWDRLLYANCIGGNELEVCAAMSRMAARGAKAVVVDYIGNIEPSRRQQDRRNEIRWMLSRLRAHAYRVKVALIVVSQLKRPENGNPNTEPTKHSLKESGDLENAAEWIIGLWRTKECDSAPIQVRLLKAKTGGTGNSWKLERRGSRLVEV
jgi:replicative DNA helicase